MKKWFVFLFVLSFLYVYSQPHKSIMQLELEHYDSLKIPALEYYKINKPAPRRKSATSNCKLNYIVWGYHPYWMNGYEANYQWNLLSDFVYFSYEVNPNTGDPNTTHSWLTADAVTTAKNNGVRIHLCATLFSDHSTFLNSESAKRNFFDKIVYYLKQRNANGVNIDFEGVSSSLRDSMTSFLIRLATRVHHDIPNSIVSVALPAVDWGPVFDIAALKNYLDYFVIMGYDYYWNGSSTAGPNSPMFKFQSSYDYDLSKSITFYLKQGLPPSKLILGIPYYGREWPTKSSSVPSSTTGTGKTRTYKYVKSNPSTYSTRHWEEKSFTPYYVFYDSGNDTWKQCFIDDEASLKYRYKYLVRYRGLAGIGIWALGYDDGYTQLWQAIADELSDCMQVPCHDTIFDIGGGPSWDYYPREDYTFTIAPDSAEQVKLYFSSFDLESGYDSLWVYDGVGTDGELLAALSGNTLPDTIYSKSKALTLKFHSDGATQKSGFYGFWDCASVFHMPCILMSENFSTGLPNGWKIVVMPDGDPDYVWRFDNPGNRYIPDSIAQGRFAIFDDDDYGDNGKKSHCALVSDTLNCSAYSEIILKFSHLFRHSVNNPADAYLEISGDGGNTWTVLDHWRSQSDTANLTYDISQYAAHKQKVLLRWRYEDAANWSNYWAIDNVEVFVRLEGFKTIKPDGTGDFRSFTQALKAIKHCGVCSGGVTFLVQPNEVYDENLEPITLTTTADRPVIFKSADTSQTNPVLMASGTDSDTDAVLQLKGTDYFTFENIDFKAKDNKVEYGVYVTNASPTDGAQHNTFKNCKITLFNNNTKTVGIKQNVSVYDVQAQSGTNSFNNYINITVNSAYQGIQLFGYEPNPSYWDNGCLVKGCTIDNFGLAGGSSRAVGILTWGQKNLLIDSNTVRNGTTNLRTLGIYAAGNNENVVMSHNTVYNLYGVGIQVVGLRAYSSKVKFDANRVYDIRGEKMASGIESYGGHDTIVNNFISQIKCPNANAISNGYPGSRGISLRETDGYVYFNTVYLTDTSANSNNQNAGIYVQNSTSDIRNNIIINKSDFSTGNVSGAIYFKYTKDLTTRLNSATGHNLYYTLSTPTAKNPIAYVSENTTAYITLDDYISAASPKENATITEFPQFVNISKYPYDLHIWPNSTPNLENAGEPITNPLIITDFDGDTRDASHPDLGADEFFHYIRWTGDKSQAWYALENWCPQIVPDENFEVRISKAKNYPLIADTTAKCKSLIVDTLTHLTVTSGGALNVVGDIKVGWDPSRIIIENDEKGFGSLLTNSKAYGTLKLNLYGKQWHYVSSPVSGAPVSLFEQPNFYIYDETKRDWWTDGQLYGESGWTKVTDGTLAVMHGYAYFHKPQTIVFKGIFNKGDFELDNLTFTHYDGVDDSYAGWHLIGNPYPAYIDWYSGTENSSIVLNNVDNTIYYFNGVTQNYEYYNGNAAQGSSGFNGSLNQGSRFIPPAQGFFIHANQDGASISISQGALKKAKAPFYKKNAGTDKFIVIKAQNQSYADEAALVENPEATYRFDANFDAYKLFSSNAQVPQVFFVDSGVQYAIDVLPKIKDTVYNLNFYAKDTGIYVISLERFNFDEDIYLVDVQTGSAYNLKQGPYEFYHLGGLKEFYLTLGKQTTKTHIHGKIKLYPNPASDFLIIANLPAGLKTISVYDLEGRLVLTKQSGNSTVRLDLTHLSTGSYIVKISTIKSLKSFVIFKK